LKPARQTVEILSKKYPIQKRGVGVAQVVDCLPCKFKALSLNPITAKKKKIAHLRHFVTVMES
jgi:hypothetical protein